ncbi:MAG: site-2 protease family protein, partial [Gammaproteobacteria bacterium]
MSLFQKIFLGAVPVVFAITVHEVAHGWVASRLGDQTARLRGRLTLNPLRHIDPVGTVLLPIILLSLSNFVFGWAKPVPVNTRNLGGHWKRKFMIIVAAGPASNVVMAAIAAIGVRLIGFESAGAPIFLFLLMMVIINVLLAVFN